MIRHVALFTWDDGMTEEMERQFAAELTALAARVPGVRAYSAGPDAGIVDGNFDFAVVADFDDAESYLAYRNHPAHRAAVDQVISPIVRQRAAIQYEL